MEQSAEGDPVYQALWEHSAAKPDAVEDQPWEGDFVFKVRGKIFVFLGSPGRGAMTVKAHPDELEALLAMPNVERAPYVGRYGWVRVQLDGPESLDLARDLIDTSYTLVAKKKR